MDPFNAVVYGTEQPEPELELLGVPEPTEAMVTSAARPGGNGKPTIDATFPSGINPITKKNIRAEATRLFDFLDEANAIYFSEIISSHEDISGKVRPQKMITNFVHGITTEAIIGLCFGYAGAKKYRKKTLGDQIRFIKRWGNDVEKQVVTEIMEPAICLMYRYKYGDPMTDQLQSFPKLCDTHPRYHYDSIVKRGSRGGGERESDAGRCGFAPWENKWLMTQMGTDADGRPQAGRSRSCYRGHMMELVILADRVHPTFFKKFNCYHRDVNNALINPNGGTVAARIQANKTNHLRLYEDGAPSAVVEDESEVDAPP